MISGRWKVAHDLLHTTQPATRAEHTSGLLIFSSAILTKHYTYILYIVRLPRNCFWLFHNLTVQADSYESIPRGPISDNYVFNIRAWVLHIDDPAYEVTQITWCNFTNVNKQNKKHSSCWLPASITLNVVFTKMSYSHCGSVWNMY